MADDITIKADQLPTYISVPPFHTVEFLGSQGGLLGHMPTPREFTAKPVLDEKLAPHCPITCKFTSHPEKADELDAHLPPGIKESK